MNRKRLESAYIDYICRGWIDFSNTVLQEVGKDLHFKIIGNVMDNTSIIRLQEILDKHIKESDND